MCVRIVFAVIVGIGKISVTEEAPSSIQASQPASRGGFHSPNYRCASLKLKREIARLDWTSDGARVQVKANNGVKNEGSTGTPALRRVRSCSSHWGYASDLEKHPSPSRVTRMQGLFS